MFNPNIQIGDVLSESEIHRVFECQTQLGIRLSTKNHAIVIVSNAMPDNIYADVWQDGVLYYTGTNASSFNGNQTLSGPGNNNGALKAVWDEPQATTIFLFVKYAQNQCTYKGVVKLAKEPYQEPRKSNPSQTVWKFPLQLVNVDAETLQKGFTEQEKKSSQKSEETLRRIAEKKSQNPNKKKPTKRTASSAVYDRDQDISAYVKIRAHGYCDLCGNKAPFEDEGQPYLESHHIVWLARGGEDVPANMAALCPNCHRKMHVLDLDEDKTVLKAKIQQYTV